MFHIAIIKSLLLLVTIVMQPNGVGIINSNGESHSCGGDLNGYYTTGTNEINICKSAPNKKRTLIHELGHYVYFNKLSKRQRDYWENIRDESLTERYELFAEVFRERVQNDNRLCKGDLEDCFKENKFMDNVFLLLKK